MQNSLPNFVCQVCQNFLCKSWLSQRIVPQIVPQINKFVRSGQSLCDIDSDIQTAKLEAAKIQKEIAENNKLMATLTSQHTNLKEIAFTLVKISKQFSLKALPMFGYYPKVSFE